MFYTNIATKLHITSTFCGLLYVLCYDNYLSPIIIRSVDHISTYVPVALIISLSKVLRAALSTLT